MTRRDPALVLILGFFTCGLYLLHWYYLVYAELEQHHGEPVTTTGYWMDLLFCVLTCGVYGIWVDYQISRILNDLQRKHGLPERDTTTLVVVLDIGAYFTGWLTNLVSSAIQQEQLNKITDAQAPPVAVA